MNSVLEKYLQDETVRLTKKAAAYQTWGTIALLVFLAYASLIVWVASRVTNPTEVSNFVLYSAHKSLPGLIEESEKSLIKNATKNSEAFSRKASAAIPLMTIQAQYTFNGIIDEQMSILDQKLPKLSRTYMQDYSKELRERGADESPSDYAKRVADALADNYLAAMHKKKRSDFGLKIVDSNTGSKALLQGYNDHLAALAAGVFEQQSRSDQAERLLLSYLTKYYFGSFPKQ